MKKKRNSIRTSLRILLCIISVIIIITSTFSVVADKKDVSILKKNFSPEFEKAVTVIKKYEGLHRNKGALIGYGHQVIRGDKYKRGANLTEAQADALLREDLAKLCAKYRSFGKDSLILSALAYNCGIGTVAKSSVYKKLKQGDRNIKASYLSYNRIRGKANSQLKRRRNEEYDTLFIP